MMKRLGYIVEKIADIGGYFSGWLVFLMMILVFVEVFMRYVLRRPPMVADEFSAYMTDQVDLDTAVQRAQQRMASLL